MEKRKTPKNRQLKTFSLLFETIKRLDKLILISNLNRGQIIDKLVEKEYLALKDGAAK